MAPRENKNNAYAKFWLSNKEYFSNESGHTKFDHPPHSTDLYLNVIVMRSMA